MKTILLIQLLCVVLSSTDAQIVHDTASVRQKILSVLHGQVRGWNTGDIESFMQGYAQLDSLRFASNGNVTYGWHSMLERYRRNYSTKGKMGSLTFDDIMIDSISSDAAMVFGTWRLKRDNDMPWGLFTLLFKDINGEWRIVHDHTSSGN